MPTRKPKPNPIGRPKLHKDHAKSSILPVRFNTEDRKRVEAAAKASGVNVSEWVRQTLLEAAQ
jgi:predicted HicB family RNase H-like nuclease